MNTQETENKPYGSRQDVGSHFTERKDIKVEPYATQNVTPSYGSSSASSSEVHPTQTTVQREVYKTQQQYPQHQEQQHEQYQTRRSVQRGWSQYDTDQLKNPIVATLLGLSLAFLLLSLTHFLPSFHLPRLHWGKHEDKSMTGQDYYDYQRYGARDGDYWRDRDHEQWRNRDQWRHHDEHPQASSRWGRWFGRDHPDDHPQAQQPSRFGRWFGRGRGQQQHPEEVMEDARDKMYEARDRASGMYQNAKDSVYNTAESVYETARDSIPGMNYMMGNQRTQGGSGGGYYPSTGSFKDEAQRQACNTAERVRDYACGYDSGSSYQGQAQRMMDSARHAGDRVMGGARNAQDQVYESRESIARRASDLYEQAKNKAGDVLQGAKETVTYPVNVAMDAAQAVKDTVNSNVQAAKDTVQGTTNAAKDTVQNTGDVAASRLQAAKDTVTGIPQAVKDTVTGAAEAVKDTVTGAYETVKEHTPGFGGSSTNEQVCVGENCKGHNTKAQIKVEVREV